MNDNELKKAYSILGLSEDASKDDVDNRYAILLKKQRSQKSRTGNVTADSSDVNNDYNEINKAYRHIIQHHKEQASLAFEEKYYKASHRKWKLDKFDHFWQYNKIRLISALLVIVVIVYGINTYLDKRAERIALAKLPPANIEIMFYGDFYTEDIKPLEQALLEQMPDWQRVIITVTQIPSNPSDPYAIALQQKAIINLMTEKPDIYIMDRAAFNVLSNQHALLQANEWLDQIQSRFTTEQKLLGQGQDDVEPLWYGVNLSGNTVFQDKGLFGEEYILGMRFDSNRKQAARELVELFLEKSS